MVLPAYLSRSRHGIFYFRWPLPSAKGCAYRTTLRLSLRTRCPKRAGVLARHLASSAEEVRSRLPVDVMTYAEVREHVRRVYSDILQQRLKQLSEDGPPDAARAELRKSALDDAQEPLEARYAFLGEEQAEFDLEGFAERSGLDLELLKAKRAWILPEIHNARRSLLEELQRAQEALSRVDLAHGSPAQTLAPAEPMEASLPGTRLGEVIRAYLKEHERPGVWVPRTYAKKAASLALLAQILPAELTVEAMTKENAREVKSVLLKLPANREKNPKTRKLSLLEACEADGVAKIGPETINAYISAFHAFFEWTVNQGYSRANVFDGLKGLCCTDRVADRVPLSPDRLTPRLP